MTTHSSEYRSALGRARGLGSAHHGTYHWWMQRLSSAALAPLGLWLLYALMHLRGESLAVIQQWLAHPLNGTLMLATVWTSLYHSLLGLQVIAEDYIHIYRYRVLFMIMLKILFFMMACITLIVMIRIIGQYT